MHRRVARVRKGVASLVPALALAVLLAGWTPSPSFAQGGAPAGAPPPAVTVAPVVAKDVAPSTEFIGRTQAIQSVELRARVEGFLEQVAFQDGQDVKAGDLLYQIEQAPYQAAVQLAQAQLAGAQANLKQAEANYKRQAELRRSDFQSQAVLDQAVAARDSAAATVQADEAALKTAQLNLGYTTITSPIDGRIGKTAYTKGNLVGPTSNALATVVQLDPIRVVFSVADRDVITEKQQSGQAQEQIIQRFLPTLRLSNGSEYPQKGEIEFVDNTVDPATATVPIWARFPNPEKLLLPGQFATVVVRPEQSERRPVVPLSAVQEDKDGKFVLVVGGDDKAQERRIKVTRQLGQDWIVDQGLSEGETVIVDGLQKVRAGQPVKPVQAAQAQQSPPPQQRQQEASQTQRSQSGTGR
ncbi:MAG TPA: efflux RND transporter periplasmic adaptor subunit [Stellaceae bacterium]